MLLIISLFYTYPLSATIVLLVKMMIMYDKMYDIYTIEGSKHLKGDTTKERKKENKFVKKGIFVSGEFSGLCVKNVRKYFITVCKKKKERNEENK